PWTGRRKTPGDWLHALECRQCDANYFLWWKGDYYDGDTRRGFASIPVDPKRAFTNPLYVAASDTSTGNYGGSTIAGMIAARNFDYGPSNGADYHRINRCEPCEQLPCTFCQLSRQTSYFNGRDASSGLHAIGDQRPTLLRVNTSLHAGGEEFTGSVLFPRPPLSDQCRRHCYGSAKYHDTLLLRSTWGAVYGTVLDYKRMRDNPEIDHSFLDTYVSLHCEFCKHASPGCKRCQRLQFPDVNTDAWFRRPWGYRSVENYANADPDEMQSQSAVGDPRNYT
ncbi:unnamed protein product, partial [Amoebophrya sp. A120]